jgi:hypothetical protein
MLLKKLSNCKHRDFTLYRQSFSVLDPCEYVKDLFDKLHYKREIILFLLLDFVKRTFHN